MLTCFTPALFREKFLPEIKLKELDLRFLHGDSIHYRNVNLFLKTQKETLEILALEQIIGHETLTTILSLQRLKKLKFGEIIEINPSEILEAVFPQNLSVETLTIYKCRSNLSAWFLRTLPKIKFFNIVFLDDEVADFISISCKFLTHIQAHWFCAKNIADEPFFLNLEKFCSWKIGIREPRSRVLFKKLGGVKKRVLL